MKTALIAGASGLIGQSLVKQLLDCKNFHKVIALVRRPLEIDHPKLTIHIIDFDKIKTFQTPEKVDHVFCCLGTTIKTAGSKAAFTIVDYTYVTELGHWTANNQCELFSVVSSVGATTKTSNFYLSTKGKMEAVISSLKIESIHIFRPSLLIGDRREFRLGEKLSELFMWLFQPLLVGGLRKYRAIKAKEVALAMCKKAQSDNKGVQIFEGKLIG